MGRRWTVNWIVVVAVIVHGAWGVMLLFGDAPLGCTPMADSPFRHNRFLASAVYLLAAVLATLPVLWPRLDHGVWGLFSCLPQQFLLMLSSFTACRCVIQGQYADGVPRPWAFILADQLWVIVGMTCHTLALIDWHYWSVRGR